MRHADKLSFLESGAVISLDETRVLAAWTDGMRLASPIPGDIRPHFYIPDFFLEAPLPWLRFSKWKIFERLDLSRQLPDFSLSLSFVPPSRDIFFEDIEGLKEMIQKGLLKKGVPYIAETGKLQSKNAWGSALKSALKSNVGYVMGFFEGDEGMVGCTPEKLFFGKSHEKSFQSMACAGTKWDQESINEKDAKEHHYVIEGMKDRLALLGGRISSGVMEERVFADLSHMVTAITINTPHPLSFMDKVNALHPTPALGIHPFNPSGVKWIRDLNERIPRGRFGAPFGLLFGDDEIVFVAIRILQWKKQEFKLLAGCGVIAESSPEKEWQEASRKLSYIRQVLGISK